MTAGPYLAPRPYVRGRLLDTSRWECECWAGGTASTHATACEAAAEHVRGVHFDHGRES